MLSVSAFRQGKVKELISFILTPDQANSLSLQRKEWKSAEFLITLLTNLLCIRKSGSQKSLQDEEPEESNFQPAGWMSTPDSFLQRPPPQKKSTLLWEIRNQLPAYLSLARSELLVGARELAPVNTNEINMLNSEAFSWNITSICEKLHLESRVKEAGYARG